MQTLQKKIFFGLSACCPENIQNNFRRTFNLLLREIEQTQFKNINHKSTFVTYLNE